MCDALFVKEIYELGAIGQQVVMRAIVHINSKKGIPASMQGGFNPSRVGLFEEPQLAYSTA